MAFSQSCLQTKKKNSFTTVTTIVILLCLILFFAGQVLPVAVVMARFHMTYVLATVPPQEIKQQITTYGVRIEKELYYWEELVGFGLIPNLTPPSWL